MALAVSSVLSTSTSLKVGCVSLKKPMACTHKIGLLHLLEDSSLGFMQSRKMVMYGYMGRGSSRSKANYYFDSSIPTTTATKKIMADCCLVIPPPRFKEPRAIIKFLGGAFIGAVPHVSYSYLLELLAKEGFLVVSVPYNVTFDHAEAAKQVYERFNCCLDNLLTSGVSDANLTPSQLTDLPIYSVGHSNGALLQVLTGSYFSEKIPQANAIISFNNRPATEAVPYFEQFGPLVSQVMPIVEESPVPTVGRSVSDLWKLLVDTAGELMPNNNEEVLISFNQFFDQLPLVLGQVTQGISEFRPTPSENRDCFQCSYNIQNTLLVKFSFDTIDETDLLEETLKPRVECIGGTLEKIQLSGNHITPCIQEPKWQVGRLYTPADAIAQGLKAVSLNDIKTLSKAISSWFRQFED